MKNVPKMFAASAVAGVVVGGIALLEGFPPGRIIAAAVIGFAVMMGLLIILRWRP